MSKKSETKYKRIIIKLGTRLLTGGKKNLDLGISSLESAFVPPDTATETGGRATGTSRR